MSDPVQDTGDKTMSKKQILELLFYGGNGSFTNKGIT